MEENVRGRSASPEPGRDKSDEDMPMRNELRLVLGVLKERKGGISWTV